MLPLHESLPLPLSLLLPVFASALALAFAFASALAFARAFASAHACTSATLRQIYCIYVLPPTATSACGDTVAMFASFIYS